MVVLFAAEAFAQRAPAIPGVTGTLTTPQTVKEEYRVAHEIIVATADGVKHMFPEGKGPLSDLTPGSSVAVYFVSDVTDAMVSEVNVGDGEITLRYASGTTEKLLLTDKVAGEPGDAAQKAASGTRVVVYTANNGKGRIARYFKPKS